VDREEEEHPLEANTVDMPEVLRDTDNKDVDHRDRMVDHHNMAAPMYQEWVRVECRDRFRDNLEEWECPNNHLPRE